MPNSKFLATLLVPALGFTGYSLWKKAEDALAELERNGTNQIAIAATVVAATHQPAPTAPNPAVEKPAQPAPSSAPEVAAPTPAVVAFAKPEPVSVAELAVNSTATSTIQPVQTREEEKLPPIAAGPVAPVPMPAAITKATQEEAAVVATEAIVETKAKITFENADLLSATEQGILQATLTSNGRERTNAVLRNNSPTPLRVAIPAGQVLESGRNLVVTLRSTEAELMPAQSTEVRISTAAVFSANRIGEAAYRISYQSMPKLDGYLAWLSQHPEVSTSAAQTAVLALTENLPLNALAKFNPANGIASKLNTTAFRVDTGDLVSALASLRASGARMETLAITLDPQLRIEAMIEPLSRESAKRYYGISEEKEWDFWRNELLTGDPGTRHYALFGIARFYPDVALEMLPKWVREVKTHTVYRMAAVQALADTQRPEALPVLRTLVDELGATTDLGKAANQAAQYLDGRLGESNRQHAVAFRGREGVSGL